MSESIDLAIAIPIAQAVREVAPKAAPAAATIRRWVTHGVCGVCLPAKTVGSVWVTTPDEVRTFFDLCERAKRERLGATTAQDAAVEAAHERLAEDGFGGKRNKRRTLSR